MNTRDILSYLPRPRIAEFPKGYAIYGAERPAEHLHLVISGYIRVFSTARDGRRLLLRMVSRDGLFGDAPWSRRTWRCSKAPWRWTGLRR